MLPPNFDPSLWDSEELEIWRSQGYRCVVCSKWADTIHEIVPKSIAPKTWMVLENRVPLCNQCHELAHLKGTRNSADGLRALRKQRLEEYASSKQEFSS